MSKTWKILTAALMAVGTASWTLGAGDGYDAPSASPDVNWIAWIFAAAFLIAIAVLGFKHSRRTHLD